MIVCNPVIGETLWGVSAHQTKILSSCTYIASHPRVRHLEQGQHPSHNFAPKQEWQPVLHHPHWLFLQVGGGSCTMAALWRSFQIRAGSFGRSPWRANRLQAQAYQCLSPPIQWPWRAFMTADSRAVIWVPLWRISWRQSTDLWSSMKKMEKKLILILWCTSHLFSSRLGRKTVEHLQ